MGSGASSVADQRIALQEFCSGLNPNANEPLLRELPAEALTVIKTAVAKEDVRRRDLDLENAVVDKGAQLLEQLGGRPKVKELESHSNNIFSLMLEKCSSHQRRTQDIIYQGAGLQKLLDDGHLVKPVFDSVCEHIVTRFAETSKLECRFIPGPVKGLTRAEVKVRVDLNGNVTKLKDVVRGTISITSTPGPNTLKQVYVALEDFVRHAKKIVPGTAVTVLSFKDRYQKPAGEYRDWQFFLSVNGFVCELQVNFAAAIEQKEDVQHKKYELIRMAQDNLQYAAMRGDATAVLLMLQTNVDPRIVDSNKCTPLHYAAAYGNVQMCNDLIKAGADLFALDGTGCLPVQRAMLMGHSAAAELLVEHMCSSKLVDISPELSQALMSCWGASPPSCAEKMTDLLIKNAEMSDADQLYFGILSSNDVACKLLQEKRNSSTAFDEVYFDHHTGLFGRLLDIAVSNGAREVQQLLFEFHTTGVKGAADSHSVHEVQPTALCYAKDDNAAALEVMLGLARDLKAELDLERLLQQAAEHRSFEAVQVLLRSGATLGRACAPLELNLLKATATGDLKMVDLVLNARVDVNVMVERHTALKVAAEFGQIKMCQLLLDRGAQWNKKCFGDITPLGIAAWNNRLSVVKLMHSRNAHLSAPAWKDRNLLQLAQEVGKPSMVALIESLWDKSAG